MKKPHLIKMLVLFGVLTLTLCSAFLPPFVKAQTVTFNGVDTQQFPYYSMYPSEIYEFNFTYVDGSFVIANETYARYKLTHGNESTLFHPPYQPGYAIWSDYESINATTDTITSQGSNIQIAFWNASSSLNGTYLHFIPVDLGGQVNSSVFDTVLEYWNSFKILEFGGGYFNNYSFHYWNSSTEYRKGVYSPTGVMIYYEERSDLHEIWGEQTLMSQPAQLPPEFNFTTESGVLNVSSISIKLDVNITDADNNNDGVTDTDYQYRVKIVSIWSNWTVLSGLIDYDISGVPGGSHQITLEVKNMYGITQEQITIHYTAPPQIPGFSVLLTAIVLFIGVSFSLLKHRKRVF